MSISSRKKYLARLRHRYAELMNRACELYNNAGLFLSADEAREFSWLARRCAELQLVVEKAALFPDARDLHNTDADAG